MYDSNSLPPKYTRPPWGNSRPPFFLTPAHCGGFEPGRLRSFENHPIADTIFRSMAVRRLAIGLIFYSTSASI